MHPKIYRPRGPKVLPAPLLAACAAPNRPEVRATGPYLAGQELPVSVAYTEGKP